MREPSDCQCLSSDGKSETSEKNPLIATLVDSAVYEVQKIRQQDEIVKQSRG